MTLLLMTGTIRPATGARELVRTNVEDRIADYRIALTHNVELLRQGVIKGLIFAENSGFGMEPFFDLVPDADIRGRVELISYDAKQSPTETRFMGEINLLQTALNRSRLFDATSDGHIWKVTGRYIVRNLRSILGHSEGDYDMILHCRDYPMRYVDFGLVGFRCSAAAAIVDRIASVERLEQLDERVVRSMIDDGQLEGFAIRPRLSHIPDFAGIRGSDNRSYQGVRYRLRYMVRSIAHRLFPKVWI